MYESYFGLTGAPFLLNPDPSFYFDSKGHSSALAYLKFGLYQAEGFIVITGDIGAGKTTLVRTLLSDIDTEKVVAAQLVSTQLEAGDLLRSTLTAFGVPLQGNTKAELLATLEAYLTLLATQKKRAVLIVDEAQNLSRDAIEELRMLSNFQFGSQALLQSFLIGQPELRDMLLSRSLEQLRQRVIASYHLGPIARDETRRYIEHRLNLVGWQQDPRFDDDAFDEIFQWTSGIPRRINLLCNRLLLATYLAEGHDITAATVAKVAMEIRAEIGEPTVTRVDSLQAPTQDPLHLPEANPAAAMVQAPFNPLAGLMTAAPPEVPTASWALGNATVSPNDQHLLIVASSRSGCVRAAALQRAFASRNDLPPLRLLVINTADGFTLSGDWCEHLGLREPDFTLRVQGGGSATQLADIVRQTDHLLREYRPSGVIVQGGDDAALAVALTAHRQQLPIIHLEAGLRSFDRNRATEINAMMCDHIADLLLTSEWVAHDNLSREGVSSDRVHFVGNLIMDSLRAMLPQASPPKYTLRQFNLPIELLKHKQGYGVVYLESTLDAANPEQNQQIASVLKSIARDMPLIWVCSPRTQALLDQFHLLEGVDASQFALLPIIPYFKMIGLVGTAACVLTDAMPVQEEATIMGIPCLTLQNYTERRITVEQGTNVAVGLNSSIIHRSVAEIMRGGGKKGRLPKFWDGLTGARLAEVLAAWRKQQGARPVAAEKRA